MKQARPTRQTTSSTNHKVHVGEQLRWISKHQQKKAANWQPNPNLKFKNVVPICTTLSSDHPIRSHVGPTCTILQSRQPATELHRKSEGATETQRKSNTRSTRKSNQTNLIWTWKKTITYIQIGERTEIQPSMMLRQQPLEQIKLNAPVTEHPNQSDRKGKQRSINRRTSKSDQN